MRYHDQLIQQAMYLLYKEPSVPEQASLRRAVSAAYYALFHLLISETTLNWSRQSSRNTLGRMFDHGLMKKVSRKIRDARFIGEDASVVQQLKLVAEIFVQLQDKRHIADYDHDTIWTRTEAVEEVRLAVEAVAAWRSIRDENIAQEYLVSLLLKPRD